MGWEIAIAAISLLLGFAFEVTTQKGAEARSAHETRVRSLFQVVRDRFGISADQLNQMAEKLDIKLSQLTDSTRGSARLSIASRKLREFVSQYPEMKAKINSAKNEISTAIQNLNSAEAQRASEIQSRKDVTSLQLLEDIAPEINRVNTALGTVNNGTDNKPNKIDTNLVSGSTYSQEERKREAIKNAPATGGSLGDAIANQKQFAMEQNPELFEDEIKQIEQYKKGK